MNMQENNWYKYNMCIQNRHIELTGQDVQIKT